jgi:predicted HicB family RNase H-like nuclease
MTHDPLLPILHPHGEQFPVEAPAAIGPVTLDTFAGPVKVEWDASSPLTPLGQIVYFIEFLKVSGRFEALVGDCPFVYASPNAPEVRDVIGTWVLSVLAGHSRYAHIAALRGDSVLPELLALERIVSEDSVRRALKAMPEAEGLGWLQRKRGSMTALKETRGKTTVTELQMTPTEYLKKPYGRVVVPESDGTFRAEIVEFPGCIAVGETSAEALSNLEDVAASWLQAVLSKGQRVPPPIENAGFSGKLMVRLPKSLHKKAAHMAAHEGVSLNQFIVSSIAEQVGSRSPSTGFPPNMPEGVSPDAAVVNPSESNKRSRTSSSSA